MNTLADLVTPPGALFTDLYELTMAQAYVADGQVQQAEFEVFFRSLAPARGYVLAAGLETVIRDLAQFRFRDDELDYLAGLGRFDTPFLDWLARQRFDGDIDAVVEGTAVFPHEPLLRVRASLPLVQLLETRILNTVNYQSLIATKAARIVDAANGAAVVDFGARRAHGFDAACLAARAAWIAGCAGTSNMVAGQRLGIPVSGTMAHSYVQAWPEEQEAFRAFLRHYPDTTLLVDTWDTARGVEHVIALAAEMGSDFRVQAIRIDSGDLDKSSHQARRQLDAAGLEQVKIIASGRLDEFRIEELGRSAAPIDGYGVGTDLVTSRDLPTLDFTYKLVSLDGEPRMKASTSKETLPGPKQVFRTWRDNAMHADVIAGAGETLHGEALLQPVVRSGVPVGEPVSLATIRAHAEQQRQALPAHLRRPNPGEPAYPVETSPALSALAEQLLARHGRPRTGP